MKRILLLTVVSLIVSAGPASAYTIDHVSDGDTVKLTNGQSVRLVQIDTPEVFFSPECYGRQASNATKRLLPPGTQVRLYREPNADSVDRYGRLLRYVYIGDSNVNVNLLLVAQGAATPYFYDHRRGYIAGILEQRALGARSRRAGLWGRCPGTLYNPYHGVATGPA